MIKNKTTTKQQKFLNYLKDPMLAKIRNTCEIFKGIYPQCNKNFKFYETKIDNTLYIIKIKYNNDDNNKFTISLGVTSHLLCSILHDKIQNITIGIKIIYHSDYEYQNYTTLHITRNEN